MFHTYSYAFMDMMILSTVRSIDDNDDSHTIIGEMNQ